MNKSDSIAALSAALSKLQGEVQTLHKDTEGYGYKYVELSSVLDAVRPLLAKYELAVSQLTVNDPLNPTVVGVEGVLMHSSGEWISSTLYMPVEPKKPLSLAQCSGVVISYIRRYQLAAMLSIAQTDTDAAIEKETAKPIPVSNHYITLIELIAEKKLEDKIDAWRTFYKVDKLSDLYEGQMLKLIEKIKEAN